MEFQTQGSYKTLFSYVGFYCIHPNGLLIGTRTLKDNFRYNPELMSPSFSESKHFTCSMREIFKVVVHKPSYQWVHSDLDLEDKSMKLASLAVQVDLTSSKQYHFPAHKYRSLCALLSSEL